VTCTSASRDSLNALTGSTVGGKPSSLTYDFLKTMLRDHPDCQGGLSNIYMVGDNPASDIAGANGAGWKSILVRTGVYRGHREPSAKPTVILDDALDAVRWALEQEGIDV